MLCALLIPSCSITELAKQAAKEYWNENGKDIVKDAADVAKNYWNENKQSVIDSATATAIAYVDKKLVDQRRKVIAKLMSDGVKMSEIDVDSDGNVTDEELDTYVKKNPSALLIGGPLAIWWALWQLKRKLQPKDEAEPIST